MNIFEKYSAYIKDNPKHLWFKRKLYGWGWTPVTWQGWAVIVGFLTVLAFDFFYIAQPLPEFDVPPIAFLLRTLLYVGVLIALCYKKGEKPRWQWGLPKTKMKRSKKMTRTSDVCHF
jgi:hypothetical protein